MNEQDTIKLVKATITEALTEAGLVKKTDTDTGSDSAAQAEARPIFKGDPTNAADIVIVAADNLSFPTTAQQHVRLTNTAPNNAIDYAIQIGPQAPAMTLNVVASDLTLDVSNGDTAELTLQVSGGVPPYTFTYDGEGFTNAADSFLPVSGQITSGDASTLWTPDAGVPGSENHVIWVRVQDSATTPNVATDSVIVNVVP